MTKRRRIAYIPARSGSKGVPRKNVKMLCGKPLLGWMVQAALDTGLFDRVMVSTDSEEFARIAESCGAWVPFLRDPEFAKDITSTIEAVCSDTVRLSQLGETYDVFCLLQPTSPLCRAEDIIGAMELFERVGAGVVSIVRSKAKPTIMRRLEADGRVCPILSSRQILRRQEEPVFYELNGAVYINAWSEITPSLKFGYNPYGYEMSSISSIDIDSEEDFLIAEKYLQMRIDGLTM